MRIPILSLLYILSSIYTVAYVCRIIWLKKHDKAIKLDLISVLAIPAVVITSTGFILIATIAIVGLD